jgi:sulfonate transport system permease protein
MKVRRFSGALFAELALPVVLVLAWWVISGRDHSLYVPSLQSIVKEMGTSQFRHSIASALLVSGKNFAIGIAIALVVGVVGGLIVGSWKLLYEALFPLLEFCRAVPAVAVLPMAILFFGIGSEMKIIVIAFGCVWPIFLNATDAVRGIEPVLRDTADCYRIGTRDRMTHVLLPAIGPQVIAGCRTALGIGIAVVVISEMVGSSNGIGYFILDAQRTYSFTDMWGGTIVLGLVGYIVNLSFRGVEKSLLRRHGPTLIGEL